MASIERLIPHILQWECGVTVRKGETPESAYARARAKGVTTVKGDAGGATLCGVTIGTFSDWRRRQGRPIPTVGDLAALDYGEWLAILKSLFWDPCKADGIANQAVADMLVDWRWVNGTQAVRDAQAAFSLVPDGIVGPKTLAALNAVPARKTFERLMCMREAAYRRIVRNRPSQKKFLKGWLNRTNAIKFTTESGT
ncbi:MAG: peptidoglycan domain protein [Clostridia bacterium]|nr:peptidoglycan domain protein [Clostridia bacterium]